MNIHEVEVCNVGHIARNLFNKKNKTIPLPGYVLETVTGRAAMTNILLFLRDTGVLKDKNDLCFVPQWMCVAFLQSIRKYCSPVPTYSDGVKVAVVYHQYGFPQNMDEIMNYSDRKNILIIEDCANVIKSEYNGVDVGGFGLGSIYSFSKMFPSIWGGALVTQNEELYEFSKKNQQRLNKPILSLFSHVTKYKSDRNRGGVSVWDNLNQMSYGVSEYTQKISQISKAIILQELKNNAIEVRIRNYQYMLNNFIDRPYFQGLEYVGVAPYILPLRADTKKLEKLVYMLSKYNIHTGIYQFDVNRNLFNPLFVPVVWIPIHQGMSLDDMNLICNIVRQWELV